MCGLQFLDQPKCFTVLSIVLVVVIVACCAVASNDNTRKMCGWLLLLSVVLFVLYWFRPPKSTPSMKNGEYRQKSTPATRPDSICDSLDDDCQQFPDDTPVEPIRKYGIKHNDGNWRHAPYSTGDIETGNPIVGENNPMGNPMTYDFYTAVNMDVPRPVFKQQQEWAQLYRPNGEVPDGLWMNPIPDQTLMALPAVQFADSSEQGRSILQTMGTGYWGHP